MAQRGGWLTPEFMGRLFLFKPPLLIWLSALSIKTFGLSLFAVRLPALLFGAAGVAGVFLWCVHGDSEPAGVLASGLLLLTPFWQVFSRVCLIDIPAASLATLALVAVTLDPRFECRRTPIAFGILGGASILAKSVAGTLPFLTLLLYYFVVRREFRPPVRRLVTAFLVAVAIAAPWHIYQASAHPRWFWADYVQVQLLGVGLRSQTNVAFARSPAFYLSRIMQMDPLLGVLVVAALSGVASVLKFRLRPAALLAFCAAAVSTLALCIFQAKHLPYITYLLPGICVVAALLRPRFLRHSGVVVSIVLALFCTKVLFSGRPWSLRPFAPPMEGARAMRQYSELGRDAELISVEPDDEFYSTTLRLPRVRYCFLDPAGAVAHAVPHYRQLGIILDVGQFTALPILLHGFEQTLQEWGLNSTEPIGSVIVLHSPTEMVNIFRARPGSDFYLPSSWEADVSAVAQSTHDLVRYSAGRIFFLSRSAHQRPREAPGIPARW